ncbi:MAG: hypothetical protein VX206_08925 [Pseudomonadota bacterium]|jgi:hypothetical protein|nr:hypothetical protein [Pseudomonadota bacterium]
MKLGNFSQVIEIYGADSAMWPEDLREDLEAFLAKNESARSLLSEYSQLEQSLDKIAVPDFPGLETRVLNQALSPRQQSLFVSLISWLLPTENFGANLWRPALAACLPLVFGIVLGNYYSFGISSEVDEFDYWEDELAMIALTDISESED